jgi:hypothetical protein
MENTGMWVGQGELHHSSQTFGQVPTEIHGVPVTNGQLVKEVSERIQCYISDLENNEDVSRSLISSLVDLSLISCSYSRSMSELGNIGALGRGR